MTTTVAQAAIEETLGKVEAKLQSTEQANWRKYVSHVSDLADGKVLTQANATTLAEVMRVFDIDKTRLMADVKLLAELREAKPIALTDPLTDEERAEHERRRVRMDTLMQAANRSERSALAYEEAQADFEELDVKVSEHRKIYRRMLERVYLLRERGLLDYLPGDDLQSIDLADVPDAQEMKLRRQFGSLH